MVAARDMHGPKNAAGPSQGLACMARPVTKHSPARPGLSRAGLDSGWPDSAHGMTTMTSHMVLALPLCTVGAGQVL